MTIFSIRPSVWKTTFLTVIAILFVNVVMAANPPIVTAQKQLAELEASSGGRIGVFAINAESNASLQYRADERFPLCSTSKVIVVSAILKRSMQNKDLLQERVTYNKNDLVAYSPVTEKHLNDGMTVSELCAAAIMYSDNTALNLLVKKLGGLAAVNDFAKSIGNTRFRLDRLEPELNSAIPGDKRDTATPKAMGKSLQLLALGNELAEFQREQLQTWLKGNTTGNKRIRAGVPKGWVVGDKTGTGDYGTSNDIAVIWPIQGSPIILAIYFTQNNQNAIPQDKVIASATRIVVDTIS